MGLFDKKQPAPEPFDYFRLGSMRLYQPEADLAERLVDGVAALAAYVKTVVWSGSEFFRLAGPTFGSLGVLIVVGVKPATRTRFWCETVGGQLPTDVWTALVPLWEGAAGNTRPEVSAPVAFALECLIGQGPREPFPTVPRGWREAVVGDHEPVEVPDGLFRVIWPD